jgi:UDP-N-acetylglucosamine--N-acetylmuramyl-(pentapeptide) pyrophosphoryl-undecaprenol N-acetylglucosamine transferase
VSPSVLADLLQKTERLALLNIGSKAKTMQKTEATLRMVAACEELAR